MKWQLNVLISILVKQVEVADKIVKMDPIPAQNMVLLATTTDKNEDTDIDDTNDTYNKAALERAELKASKKVLQIQFEQENEVLNLLNNLIYSEKDDIDEVWGKCTEFKNKSKDRLKLSKVFHQVRAKRILSLLESHCGTSSSDDQIPTSSSSKTPRPSRPRSQSANLSSTMNREKVRKVFVGCLKRSGQSLNHIKLKKFRFYERVTDLETRATSPLVLEKATIPSLSLAKREGKSVYQSILLFLVCMLC